METISRNLEDLAVFHRVASEGGFTRAAEKYGISKSMISKQVKRLETYLESQLFHRTTRTLGLTKEGRALFEYSQKIFELSSEAEKRLKEMNQGDSGMIRISAPMGLGTTFFSSFLPEISKMLPNVKFDADISNVNRNFTEDRIDFAIRANDDLAADLIARYLGQIRDVICITPALAKKIKIENDPRSLEKLECILYAHEMAWNTWTLTSASEEIQVKVEGKYTTNFYPAALSLCLKGFGIARLPFYIAAEDLSNGKLVQLFPKYQITTHPLYLVYLRNEYSSKKHQVIKKAILNWFKKQTGFFVK